MNLDVENCSVALLVKRKTLDPINALRVTPKLHARPHEATHGLQRITK